MWMYCETETRPDYVAKARRHSIQFTVPSEGVVRETATKAKDIVEKDDRKEMGFRKRRLCFDPIEVDGFVCGSTSGRSSLDIQAQVYLGRPSGQSAIEIRRGSGVEMFRFVKNTVVKGCRDSCREWCTERVVKSVDIDKAFRGQVSIGWSRSGVERSSL